jgi:hypothetical protein
MIILVRSADSQSRLHLELEWLSVITSENWILQKGEWRWCCWCVPARINSWTCFRGTCRLAAGRRLAWTALRTDRWYSLAINSACARHNGKWRDVCSPFQPYPTTMAQQHCATFPKMAITFHCSHFSDLFMNRTRHPHPLNANLHTNTILLLRRAVFSFLRCGVFLNVNFCFRLVPSTSLYAVFQHPVARHLFHFL